MSLLALDIGTGSIRGLLAADDGRIIASSRAVTPVLRGPGGAVEFDGEEVCQAALTLLRDLAGQGGNDRVRAIAFSCLGTSMVPVDAAGHLCGRGLSPLDSRPPHSLPEGVDGPQLHARTGQDPAVISTFHQFRWRATQAPGELAAAATVLSLRGLVLNRLCGVRIEDHSWASRTMLYDLAQRDWADDLLSLAGLSRRQMPTLAASTASFPIRDELIREFGLDAGAVAVAGGLDNCCGLAGAAPETDCLVNLTGTYEHLAGRVRGDSAPDFVVRAGAFAFRSLWPADLQVCSRTAVGRRLQDLLEDNAGAIPADYLRVGLPPGPAPSGVRNPEAAVQRLLEDACFEMKRFLLAYEREVRPVHAVLVVGGGAGATAALQQKANILGRKLLVPRQTEASVLGALQIAWSAVHGRPQSEAAAVFANPPARVITPDPDLHAAFNQRYQEWPHA